MSIDACAALLEKGDPDRFLAVMAAPPAARARLFPIYAFNLELARAPYLTEQPLIAEMRLQFWRDVLDDPTPRAHEVAGPLRQVISESGMDVRDLRRMVDARLWDVWREPHASAEALSGYIEDSGAGLMWAAAQALGTPATNEPALRALGWASGLANYLRAVPALKARGRSPLPGESEEGIRDLARTGLQRLDAVKGPLGPAALAGWQARPVLTAAMRDPSRVATGGLVPSEFSRRGRLLWSVMTGRF